MKQSKNGRVNNKLRDVILHAPRAVDGQWALQAVLELHEPSTTLWAVYELSEPLMSSESPASRRGYRRATRAKDCCLGFWRATWAVDQPHETSWAVVRVYKIAITTINATINQCNNQRNNQPDFTHLGNRVWFVSTSYVSCRRSTRAVVSHLRAQQALSTPYLHTSHVEILCECRASCVRGCV